MTKAIISIVGLVVGLMLIASLLPDTIASIATDDYTENFESTTGAGVTSANVTLSYSHYYEDLTNLSASSDNAADTPVVLNYDVDNYIVTVGGLAASNTRILTINYVREAHQEFTGFSSFMRLIPFITIIGLVVATIWGLFSAWKSRG